MWPSDEESARLALLRLLRSITAPGIEVGVRSIADVDLETVAADEQKIAATFGPQRQAEFHAGRALLRDLLGPVGVIGIGYLGAPLIGGHAVATLAHDRRFAVAATAQDDTWSSLGIDYEPTTELTDDEAALIVRPDDVVRDALKAFVMKEAFYKATSAATGRLDFLQVQLTSVDTTTFDAELVGAPCNTNLGRAWCRWATDGCSVVALVARSTTPR